jgi:hypothetical protein
MPRNPALTAIAFLVLGSSRMLAAQDGPAFRNEGIAEIGGRLRSFYFNLASNNWDALTADILAAKVVAHRPPPEMLLLRAATPAGAGASLVERPCSGDLSVSVHQAVIAVEGDWAEARVPHCGPVPRYDEFRLIRFAGRWRFVSIHLSQHSLSVTVER